jgi:hypothetical protein
MPSDLQTTNTWLAIAAIAITIQTLFLLVASFMGLRLYRKVESTLEHLETRYVAPAEVRFAALMDDLQDMTARARRIDDAMRARLADIGGAADVAKAAVVSRVWPIVGIARAVDAGLRALSHRASESGPQMRTTPGRRVAS